jgi:hypothetical protein
MFWAIDSLGDESAPAHDLSKEMPPQRAELLFVYNADSGLFNTMADAAHKILSPDTYSCNLCRITYGWFTEKSQWRDFIDRLDADCRFLHRDEFERDYPDVQAALPAIFRVVDGHPQPCVDAKTLDGCTDIDALIAAIRERCGV